MTDLIDTISLLNLDIEEDHTYLWRSKRIDCIMMVLALVEVALKEGHHQFNQHFISDHTGVYLHFRADDLFDTGMDKSHTSYMKL